MRKSIRYLGVAAFLSAAASGPAASDVIYRFVQTAPTALPISVSLTVAVSDSSAAAGFGVSQGGGSEDACPGIGCNYSSAPLDLSGTGISMIDLQIFTGASTPVFQLQAGSFETLFCTGGGLPDCLPAWAVEISGLQSDISVNILFNGEFDTLDFRSTNSGGTGFYASDNPDAGDCSYEGHIQCAFSGAMTMAETPLVVAAPSPASIGLLLTGLMGMMAVRRR